MATFAAGPQQLRPQQLLVWLGPAISQTYFEVGAEVRTAFLDAAIAGTSTTAAIEATDQAFLPNREKPGHYFADLYQLARLRLQALGINRIYGGDCCSFTDSQRFYSYRRDGVSGRMGSLIYKR